MIRSVRHKGLKLFLEKNDPSKIRPDLVKRVRIRLLYLNKAKKLEDLNAQGFNFHQLKGFRPVRYTIHINGPWCLTFEWKDGDVYALDMENYHEK